MRNLQLYEKRLSIENKAIQEKAENNDDDITMLDDQPCWEKVPKRHRLEDLLSIINRDTSILYDSLQYLVLNKPPDLRMDGPYPATVHKLLTYWYPSPSLSNHGECEPNQKSSTGSENVPENKIVGDDSRHNMPLIEAVSRLHKHNDVEDNFLRPCHQLDYATSGILLVAKTQQAAAHISRLFEQRHEGVQKSYLAVVVGDLRKGLFGTEAMDEGHIPNKSSPKVQIWRGGKTTRELREQLQRLEETYRRSRVAAGRQHCRIRDAANNKDKSNDRKSSFAGGTFQGFRPAHSIFAKWKSKMISISTEETLIKKNAAIKDPSCVPKKRQKRQKFKKQSVNSLLTDEVWQRIWNPVNKVVGTVKISFKDLEWKRLHKEYPALKQAIIEATDVHNNILREAVSNEEKKKQDNKNQSSDLKNDLPTLFRLPEDSNTTDDADRNINNDDNTFYICCPLAQRPDQFNMIVPTDVARLYPHLPTLPDSDNNTIESQLNFRPSLTKCTILERGKLPISHNNTKTGIDVTKVRLYPMTGRRHQLRVHMALTGFPILGDVTYGGDKYVEDMKTNSARERSIRIDMCLRMHLHAHCLQLPTLLGESTSNWKVASPDPFLFEPSGNLQLN